MAISLGSRSLYALSPSDGDHPHNDHTNIREGGRDSKEAEEVQGMARNELKQSNSALGISPEN